MTAHADLREDYLGAKLSHACVLRRCHDLLGDGRIHQFCIRSGDREEFEFAARHTDLRRFDFTGLGELTQVALRHQSAGLPDHYDLDCLDPSAFPGTGTPEAGGVSFLQLLDAIRTVTRANIVGADLNELAPHAGYQRHLHRHRLQDAAGAAAWRWCITGPKYNRLVEFLCLLSLQRK